MKIEYVEILMSLLIMAGGIALTFLIADLFIEGIFFLGMLIFLPIWTIFHLIAFIMKAFQLNYKIVKR